MSPLRWGFHTPTPAPFMWGFHTPTPPWGIGMKKKARNLSNSRHHALAGLAHGGRSRAAVGRFLWARFICGHHCGYRDHPCHKRNDIRLTAGHCARGGTLPAFPHMCGEAFSGMAPPGGSRRTGGDLSRRLPGRADRQIARRGGAGHADPFRFPAPPCRSAQGHPHERLSPAPRRRCRPARPLPDRGGQRRHCRNLG